ncbi:MAG: hypothetical protein MJE63_13880 [Proteobacteria bacterium]|nr:hypothetical protein [Pseudomonadota bacterium]
MDGKNHRQLLIAGLNTFSLEEIYVGSLARPSVWKFYPEQFQSRKLELFERDLQALKFSLNSGY